MVNQTAKIALTILLTCNGIVLGQPKVKQELSPVLKSAILPGWGQKAMGFSKRARTFQYVETGLILTIAGTSTFSNIMKKNYIAFSSQHANISSGGKNHEYWVDIGNYDSIEDYNAEHLRNREMDALYPEDKKWSWEWDTSENRRSFEKKRIQSDQLKLTATFGMGALVLNHVISTIDALYLTRTKDKPTLSVQPFQNQDVGSVGYALTIRF